MGQYYKPCILAEDRKTVKEWLYSHDYNNGLKLMEHSWDKNEFVGAFESLIRENPQHVCWAGDYADSEDGTEEGKTLYNKCTEAKELKKRPDPCIVSDRYIINHTKKEFVDKAKTLKGKAEWMEGEGWKIHPLPLLTCEGNGRGGGDFGGKDAHNIIGSWARDLISVSIEKPGKDYTEIMFDLYE